jgi:serine/threonine protein kinase
MAPEVTRHGKYSEKADVFSYAMIVNEIFTEEKPYEFLIAIEAAVGVVKRDLRPSQKRIKNERLKAVIARSWDKDPSARPSWPEIIAELEAARDEMCPADGRKGPGLGALFRRLGSAGRQHSGSSSGSASMHLRRAASAPEHAPAGPADARAASLGEPQPQPPAKE